MKYVLWLILAWWGASVVFGVWLLILDFKEGQQRRRLHRSFDSITEGLKK